MAERLRFAVFGKPIAQSLSPVMHNAAFAAMGLAAQYGAFCTAEAKEAVRLLREEGLKGASITHPLKETLLPLLDELDEEARRIGAVNTVVARQGRLVGCNTDGQGLVRDLAEWIPLAGRRFVILGAGGAARAAVFTLGRAGAHPLVVSRTAERSEALAGEFGCAWAPWEELAALKADCLLNTTPVGMSPATGETPVEARLLKQFTAVYDMIYNPGLTRLLREARASGCLVRSGLGMFVNQGALQILLWTGKEPPRDVMRRAAQEALG